MAPSKKPAAALATNEMETPPTDAELPARKRHREKGAVESNARKATGREEGPCFAIAKPAPGSNTRKAWEVTAWEEFHCTCSKCGLEIPHWRGGDGGVEFPRGTARTGRNRNVLKCAECNRTVTLVRSFDFDLGAMQGLAEDDRKKFFQRARDLKGKPLKELCNSVMAKIHKETESSGTAGEWHPKSVLMARGYLETEIDNCPSKPHPRFTTVYRIDYESDYAGTFSRPL